MNRNRCALACALAFTATGAFAQSSAPNTAVVADTLIQIYGHLDVSIDTATKGFKEGDSQAPFGTNVATGKLGWQPDISSNLSYVGLRGGRDIGGGLRAVFQFETQIDMSATPGGSMSSASSDTSVKGALASRNSYLGLATPWGAIKAGKTDAPYKLSTARMDPFSASVGDYNSIMGNTGGDNRAEFDTRLSHAAWYESPSFGGFHVDALWAPGQNRASDNSEVASGEPDCTGGNTPAAIPSTTGTCTDGSFGSAYSIAARYEAGPLYLTAAYEKHSGVNRTGDEAPPFPAAGAVGVVDENAMKAGVQYTLPTRTTLNAVYERMRRNAPDPNANERQRNGYWLAVTQQIGGKDDINAGWAHAGKTPGDPTTGPIDNEANMYTVGYKHHFDQRTNWYAVYARQDNHPGAHYDLGASGHGITTDCHDADGHCFPGKTVQAFSVGMQYNF
ncbi:MAG TPA: porin [Burkholderiales bacterium]|nr:porin [Burkholderiales bacterium]